MRPQGEIRAAFLAEIREHGPMAMRDLATRVQVSPRDAKLTLSRILQARQLVVSGREKRAHCTRWVQLYDLPPPPPEIEPRHAEGWVPLSRAIAGWAR